jgi:hypothetical protein
MASAAAVAGSHIQESDTELQIAPTVFFCTTMLNPKGPVENLHDFSPYSIAPTSATVTAARTKRQNGTDHSEVRVFAITTRYPYTKVAHIRTKGHITPRLG